MKNIIAILCSVLCFASACSVNSKVTPTVQADSKSTYTISDIQNLQSFLLAKPDTPDLTGKNYDLNQDGRWDVFDLCLMKRAYVKEKNEMKTTTYTVNNVDFKMIFVEAGTFTMGSDNTNVAFSESPEHQVTLTKDYLIGETEVTQALWNAVMTGKSGDNTMPKTSVTWSDAHDFCDKLSKIAREQGVISENQVFCLPTEAQWEFAAKGGNLSKGYLYAGGNNIDDVAVTRENSGSDSPIQVKTKKPNELGLYDMSGNAYEWVDDYGGDYSSEPQTDPQNTSGRNYVKRGGSNYHNFSNEDYLFTTTGRYFYGSTDWTIGFRLCLKEE